MRRETRKENGGVFYLIKFYIMNVSVKTTFESKDAITITFLKNSQKIVLTINGHDALLTMGELQKFTNLLSVIKPVDKK